MTVRELTLRMSTRELSSWRRYERQRRFPHDRLQLQVALLAYMERKDDSVTFEDFVIGHERATPLAAQSAPASALGALAGAGVRVLGQKRNQPYRKRKG